jgi:hypothetical protein
MPAQSFARVLAGRAKLFAWKESCEVVSLARGSLLRPYTREGAKDLKMRDLCG